MKWSKGCALLAYLIITRQAQNRELLADLLWDVSSTAQSLQNLRKLLSRMRQWVPELTVTRQQAAYPVATAATIDLHPLLMALAAADFTSLDNALRLYTGDLLNGLYLEDAPRFNEWLSVEREQWRQRVVAAYRQVCRTYAEQKGWLKGIDAAQRWLLLDTFDEEPLRFLMQFLAASGQVEEALQQYNTCRQQLWTELAVEPEPETAQLAERLAALKDETSQGIAWGVIVGAQVVWPEPDKLAEPGALPALSLIPYRRNPDFVGRQESLLHLARSLLPWPDTNESGLRAVAITGMGGLGKTQLTVEFCYRYGRYFPGGVYWLNFADATNLAEEIAQIGSERGMGLYCEADNLPQADKIGRVRKVWQEPIPRLLIFDNCEDETLLTKWLPVTGGCAVLLTSRRAYWTRELQVAEWPLPVLDVAESVYLLQNLASHLAAEAATSIAEELGHLPLALHLAGSFLRRYREITADQYLYQLRDKTVLNHPSLQGRGIDFSPTGHELDLARTFAVNWEQLDGTDETDAFALKLIACAVQFAPDELLPRDLLFAAVQVDESDLMSLLLAEDGLARLTMLGLITRDGEAMLRLHRLVAAFVRAQFESGAARQTAAAAATAVAQTIWQRLQKQWETEAVLDQLVVAPAHVQYVMEAELVKETIEAVHLSHAWGRYLLDIYDFARSRTCLEKALALCEKLMGAEHPETADILTTLGAPIWKAVSEQAAWPYFQRALSIYEQAFGPYHLKTAQSLMNLAILHARTSDYEKAIAYYQQSLTIYEQVLPPNHPEVARAFYNLAMAYRRVGNYQMALSHYELSLRIREEIWGEGNPHTLNSLASIGITYFLIGNYEAALVYQQKALAGRKERMGQQHLQTATSLGNVGIVLGFQGNYEAAIICLQDSLTIREQSFGSDHPQLVYPLTYLGFMFQATGDLAAARQLLERGKTIQETRQLENEQTAETLTFLAAVLMQQGEMEAAGRHLQHALDIWEQRPELKQSRAAATHIYWGEWQEAQGDTEAAISHYEQAVAIMKGQIVETHLGWQRAQAHLARLREG